MQTCYSYILFNLSYGNETRMESSAQFQYSKCAPAPQKKKKLREME